MKKPTGRNRRRSTLGAHVAGRRAGQRFDAERGVVTEALVFLGDLDPEAIGENLAHATHYEATPVRDFGRLIAHVPFALNDATFIDLGAGMGRVVLLAAMRPFRQVVGVELSPALTAIARRNIRCAPRDAFRCRDVRIVCADAAKYSFPRGPLVVYLYNPFDAAVLAPIAARCAAQRRPLTLVYHTPVQRAVIEVLPAFELLAEEPCGVVYRLVQHAQA
ncbi:MAG: class I SAM-dependent methyltransferase [Candidatus Eremiobacteraeota bacterium]|nr:class I SAM-dependent methyltransferase [Candidatus Eremiobacteraeota bacterium]MBC5803908.1 class I SAM-dependent methyltransferase [Candidatus Eremiobacteraeota bacterium]MBC5820380.1 class I SAM-dependent methyltransferase [Candidatus Eremiobacteraeota bacterium]